jgi:hypothetical protein
VPATLLTLLCQCCHCATLTDDTLCPSSPCQAGSCTAAAAGTGCEYKSPCPAAPANGVYTCSEGDSCASGCQLKCNAGFVLQDGACVCVVRDYFVSNAPSGCDMCSAGYAYGGQYSFVDTLPVGTTVAKLEVLGLSGSCSNNYQVLVNGAPVLAKQVNFNLCQCGNVYCERRDLGAVNTPFPYFAGLANSVTVGNGYSSSLTVRVSTCQTRV